MRTTSELLQHTVTYRPQKHTYNHTHHLDGTSSYLPQTRGLVHYSLMILQNISLDSTLLAIYKVTRPIPELLSTKWSPVKSTTNNIELQIIEKNYTHLTLTFNNCITITTHTIENSDKNQHTHQTLLY